MPPPPNASAQTIEEELAALDQKIQAGNAKPADAQGFNDLLQTLQKDERKKPKKDFPLPKLRFKGHGRFEQGFGMTMNVAASQTGACGEFKNIFYDCADLPWDAVDAWVRGGETGEVSVRECAVSDACSSPGILQIDSIDALMLGRIEEGLVGERHASATFRMRQSISERNPQPDTTLFGGGVVWIDDGVKSTAVWFGEDLNGDRLVMVPIEGQFDPETGELNITDTLVIYHDWSDWKQYWLVKDAEGMIELFVDDDASPLVSYPYSDLAMGSFGGPVVMFGNLVDGQVARVLFEFDNFNYSVGMPSNAGCVSADGKMQLLSLINMTKVFDPTYEANDVVGRLKIAAVEGLASNTQGHKFFLRATREIRDAAGSVVRLTRDDTQIGPIGTGQNQPDIIADGLSSWNGTNSQGTRAADGVYTYGLTFDLVKADSKGKEKILSTMQATGSPVMLTSSRITPRVFKNVNATKFYFAYDYIQYNEVRKFRNYAVGGCSMGADPILDVFYEQTYSENPYAKVVTDDYTPWCKCRYPYGDCGWQCSTGAYVTITPQKPGWVLLVIRAKALDKGGTCTLDRVVQGGEWGNWVKSLKFGGNRVDWGWSAGEEIQNAIMSDGQDTLMIQSNPGSYTNPFEIPPDGTGKPSWDDDKGVAKASKVVVASGLTAGSTFIGQKPWATEGASHVYRNDVDNDSDSDGLGDGLEAALQTCNGRNSSAGGWQCSNTFNTQDTDGDGLPDDIEVFGCDNLCRNFTGTGIAKKGCFTDHTPCPGVLVRSSFPQQLPKWGADPRRKDIFVEVDAHRTDLIGYTSDLPESNAKKVDELLHPITSSLVNPDGSKGIRIHLDSGQPCPNYKTVCGAWGGHTKIFDHGNHYNCDLRRLQQDFQDVVRQGVFQYSVAMPSCVSKGGAYRGTYNVTSNSVQLHAHELGHSLGLEHGGKIEDGWFNFKPNYTSLMNYAFQNRFAGDPNAVHYSNGTNPRLNPKWLCEKPGLGNEDPSYLGFFPYELFGYGVEQGVDWNRDGHIEDGCGTPVSSFVHTAKTGDAEGALFRSHFNWENVTTIVPPVLATFDGAMYLVRVRPLNSTSDVAKFRTFFQMDPNCQKEDIFATCDQWQWTFDWEAVLPGHTDMSLGVAEIPMAAGGRRLYLFYRDEDYFLRYTFADGHISNWQIPADSPLGDRKIKYAPSAVSHLGNLLVMYVGEDDVLYGRTFSAEAGMWGPEVPAVDEYGNFLRSSLAPALAERPLEGGGPLHIVYGDMGINEHQLIVKWLDEPTGVWKQGLNMVLGPKPLTPGFKPGDVRYSAGRPALVWRPDPSFRDGGGTFYLFWAHPTPTSPNNSVMVDFLARKGQNELFWEMNSAVSLNPPDATGSSGDVSATYYEKGAYANVAAVWKYQRGGITGRIAFLPYADGIYDFELGDSNDWDVMNRGTCISIRYATGDACAMCGTDPQWCYRNQNCCQNGVPPPPPPLVECSE